MRRLSQERQQARRDLALAVHDASDNAIPMSAETERKVLRRVLKCSRAVLTHILTDADYVALDGLRTRRRAKEHQRTKSVQLKLDATDSHSSTEDVVGGAQPACVNPECGTTAGLRRYDGLCAKCADNAEHKSKSKRQPRMFSREAE